MNEFTNDEFTNEPTEPEFNFSDTLDYDEEMELEEIEYQRVIEERRREREIEV